MDKERLAKLFQVIFRFPERHIKIRLNIKLTIKPGRKKGSILSASLRFLSTGFLNFCPKYSPESQWIGILDDKSKRMKRITLVHRQSIANICPLAGLRAFNQ